MRWGPSPSRPPQARPTPGPPLLPGPTPLPAPWSTLPEPPRARTVGLLPNGLAHREHGLDLPLAQGHHLQRVVAIAGRHEIHGPHLRVRSGLRVGEGEGVIVGHAVAVAVEDV